MSPSVLRQSGARYIRDGALFTPRAAVHFCEVCGSENAPFGSTDAKGKRLYHCAEHNPDRKAKGQAE